MEKFITIYDYYDKKRNIKIFNILKNCIKNSIKLWMNFFKLLKLNILHDTFFKIIFFLILYLIID